MFKNYLKAALRNMRLHKGLSFITIFGFAAGLACCILITLFAIDQLSFDRHYARAERIYRVGIVGSLNSKTFIGPVSCAPLAEAMEREIPDVESVVRFSGGGRGAPVVRYKDKVFSEERFYWADPTFFDVFSVPFIKGDPRTALSQANNVVLTSSMARKYFGSANPLGKIINTDNRRDLLVTGVVPDVPRQSHFHYDFVGSLAVFENSRSTSWIGNNFYTYLVLRPGASAAATEAKLQEIVRRNAGPQFQQMFGVSWDQLLKSGAQYRYFLQPLTDIHLRSHLEYELEANGDISTVYLFSLVAFGVFLLACVNFVNLTTARAATRAREIGIRKAIGSGRGQLIRQFLFESSLTSFLAILLALVLAMLLRPFFNRLAGANAQITVQGNPWLLPILLALLVLSGLVAGIYPAFYLSSFRPAQVLKGQLGGIKGKSFLRSLLVVFQFTLSITLIIGTLVINRQLHYMQNKKLGFSKDQVLVVKKTDDLGKQVRTFKQELLANPKIMAVSTSAGLMGDPTFGDNVYTVPGVSGVGQYLFWTMYADEGFLRTYDIQMASGRFFEKDRQSDLQGVVLNETAVKVMGLSDPVGREIVQMIDQSGKQTKITILGVIKDFHFQSLHEEIRPLAFHWMGPDGFGKTVSVRFRTTNIPVLLKSIEKTWKRLAKGQAFEYEFFDERFAANYNSEQNTARLLTAFSLLAIAIACLGLLGLATFATQQRTKEIGIRKVLGASVLNLSRLLSNEFLKLVLLANLIAWPLAYFVMNRWLRDFAYRTSLDIRLFLLSGVLALIIAMLTVSYQSIRAARANPVNSLRNE
ncbi:MAG: FtsX-like permease family protein [Chrysiogenales bacterium]|nr:MAG: FtsX-like permease family protein [Chrysiogenales bacterium]